MYYIYKITNIKNGMCYIGLTNNIARRRTRHFTDLKCNRHDNKFLQKHFNRDGKDSFTFEVIFSGNVSEFEIGEKEKEYIKLYDSYYNGYNQNEGGNFGASNGGTQLTKSDIFNILSALEFMSRPGQVLSNMFNVSKTTISRIKKGENHCIIKEEYDALPLEDRKDIFKIFSDSCNLDEKKAKSSSLVNKRFLTEEQVHLLFLNEELGRIKPISYFMKKYNIASSNTFYTILKGKSYQDYQISYNKLTNEQKEKLATLLSD